LQGEIYFRQRRWSEAIQEFLKVRRYPDPKLGKIPEASLKIGESFKNLGQYSKAEIEWNAVIRKYPKSPEAEKAKILIEGLP
jgi:TolA-binding protein